MWFEKISNNSIFSFNAYLFCPNRLTRIFIFTFLIHTIFFLKVSAYATVYSVDSHTSHIVVNSGDTIDITGSSSFTNNSDRSDGGAIYNNGGTINVTDSPLFESNSSNSFGGAISNAGGGYISITGFLSSEGIYSSLFTGNHANQGGAIDNYNSTIDITNSSFTSNYVTNDGGAINNWGGTLSITSSSFDSNHADGDGGAIYNDGDNIGTITITDSSFTNNYADGFGGVINNLAGIISITNSSFENNYSIYNGGAIYNANDATNTGTITITGSSFTNNSSSDSDGGAIYNYKGIINVINSSFTDNYSNNADGGAIYNLDGILNITDDSSFVNNSSDSNGGAIFNSSSVVSIANSSFEDNYTNGDGGAIYNDAGSTLTITNSSFTNNSSNNSGGVIYNNGTINITDSSFTNNSTSNNGGAIYNEVGTVNINAVDSDILFSGNYITTTSVYNDIFLHSYSSSSLATVNFNASSGRKITLNGGIASDNGNSYSTVIKDGEGTLELGGDNSDFLGNFTVNSGIVKLLSGSSYFNSSTISTFANGTTLDLRNNEINTNSINLGNLVINSSDTMNLKLDVDLQNSTADKITSDNSIDGSILISKINFLSGASSTGTIIISDIVGDNLKSSTSLDSSQESIVGPIYKYDISYDNTMDTLTFIANNRSSTDSFNPELYSNNTNMHNINVIQDSVINTVFSSFEDTAGINNFTTSSDSGSSLSSFNDNNTLEIASSESTTIKNSYLSDYIKNNSNLLVASANNSFRLVIDVNILNINDSNDNANDKKNVWIKIIGSDDTAEFDNFENIDVKFYSLLAGYNINQIKLNNDIKMYNGVYFGYLNGTQEYTENKTDQEGGYLGLNMLFKQSNNLFMELSSNIGFIRNTLYNDTYGQDKYNNYWLNISSKVGKNYRIMRSSYFLQPNLLLGYSLNRFDNYTSNSGVRVETDDINSLRVIPGLKISRAFKNDYVASINTKYVKTYLTNMNTKADGILVPELSSDPYIEYGIELNKDIKNKYRTYFNINRRDGGRRGWNGSARLVIKF
ncbi:MAG: hypothetical protein PHY80_00940 [Rickettsiales bacterium]|nr:hypothetical protein [Rickettsiales bacterium]